MNKREIVARIKADLQNAEHLFRLMDDVDVKMRLGAQCGYIRNLLEWIEQGGKV
jgi:hypothetical protein